MCGQVAGMITDVQSVAEVVQSLVRGYNKVVSRL